jgi:hypothetical protein
MNFDNNYKKRFKIFVLIFFACLNSKAQDNPDYILWHPENKLTTTDFGIKKSDSNSGSSFAQFYLSYTITGFDFMTKNFNKKVKNSIIKSASWIDTTQNIELSLKYQQTLFDIAEIYARRFRKELKANRKQIAKGLDIVEEINSKNSSDFSKRRLQYDSETNYSKNIEKQHIWELQIDKELNELDDFAFDK